MSPVRLIIGSPFNKEIDVPNGGTRYFDNVIPPAIITCSNKGTVAELKHFSLSKGVLRVITAEPIKEGTLFAHKPAHTTQLNIPVSLELHK